MSLIFNEKWTEKEKIHFLTMRIELLEEELNDCKKSLIDKDDELKKFKKTASASKYFAMFTLNQKIIRDLVSSSPSAFRIFHFMACNCNKRNTIHIREIDLSSILGITPKTVIDSLKLLEEHKFVKIVIDSMDNRNRFYILNSRIIWKSSLAEKFHSDFHVQPKSFKLSKERKTKKKYVERFTCTSSDLI